MATDPVFKGHSASWIAGYKERDIAAHKAELMVWSYGYECGLRGIKTQVDHLETERWLMEQDRIDHEAWLCVKSMLTGCLLVVAAYWMGRLGGKL